MFEKLRDMLCEQLDLEVDEVGIDTDLVDDLGCDSLDLFQLINDIEEEYDVEIEVNEQIRTLGDVINQIENK